MPYHILVGSYTNEIVTLTFDPAGPSLEVTSKLQVGQHPSWIASSPDYPGYAWTGLEQADGRVVTLEVGEQGRLKKLAEVSSAGSDPCHLLVHNGEVIVAIVRRMMSLTLCLLTFFLYHYLIPWSGILLGLSAF